MIIRTLKRSSRGSNIGRIIPTALRASTRPVNGCAPSSPGTTSNTIIPLSVCSRPPTFITAKRQPVSPSGRLFYKPPISNIQSGLSTACRNPSSRPPQFGSIHRRTGQMDPRNRRSAVDMWATRLPATCCLSRPRSVVHMSPAIILQE